MKRPMPSDPVDLMAADCMAAGSSPEIEDKSEENINIFAKVDL